MAPPVPFENIKFGTGLAVTDEGSGSIRVDASGGGGSGSHGLLAQWFGDLPSAPGTSPVFRVPYIDGVSVSFDLTRAWARLETAGSTTTTVVVQSSPGGGAFTPTTVASLGLIAADQEDEETGAPLGTISSGDLLRLSWTAIGTGAAGYTVQLEGTEV